MPPKLECYSLFQVHIIIFIFLGVKFRGMKVPSFTSVLFGRVGSVPAHHYKTTCTTLNELIPRPTRYKGNFLARSTDNSGRQHPQ